MEHAGVLATFDVMGDISAQPLAKPMPSAPPPPAAQMPTAANAAAMNSVNNNVVRDRKPVSTPSPSAPVSLMPLIHSKSPVGNGRSHSIFPRRPAVDVQFSDVTYHVRTISFSKRAFERKKILHEVSGEFRSGELTAIMGPSGAGKSTLLNILAGYTIRGSGGTVAVNGQPRDNTKPHAFRRLSCYIQQDDAVRPLLRVRESLLLAANLKLGSNVSAAHKARTVRELLQMLGLELHADTLSGHLSGGQKKRLSVALELVSNPPVLFLDEPTTGLDSSSCSQCIGLLQQLARQGRTVVCTIHQPSALLFDMFDHLYALAGGRCMYQGPTKGLVPFLADQRLHCPPYHNPADFLMDVSSGEFGTDLVTLAEAATKYATRRPTVHEPSALAFNYLDDEVICPPKGAPLWMQFFLLYTRNLLVLRRDLNSVAIRLMTHVGIALVFGYLYQNVGINANEVLANYVFLYGTTLFLVYTGQMAVTLAFPLEVEILSREHFNRWYSLPPYLLSVILIEMPVQMVLCLSYLAPSYILTAQPMDMFRMLQFFFTTVLASLTAQSCGFMVGSTTPVTISVFLGPVILVLLSIFGFCISYNQVPYLFKWMYHISFFRAAFQSSVYAVYGYGRELLPCPESLMYCHYRVPRKIFEDMGIDVVPHFWENITLILIFWLVVNTTTAVVIWYKLNKR